MSWYDHLDMDVFSDQRDHRGVEEYVLMLSDHLTESVRGLVLEALSYVSRHVHRIELQLSGMVAFALDFAPGHWSKVLGEELRPLVELPVSDFEGLGGGS